MKQSLETATKRFIETYNHICYCEIIIKPNGEIVEAVPSHTECLIKILGLPRETIQELIPFSDSPLSWLVRRTNCIAVWYEFQELPSNEITEEQQYVLTELANHDKIKTNTRTVRLQEDVLAELDSIQELFNLKRTLND